MFLNGTEMKFAEGGYKYVFMKPPKNVTEKTISKDNGDRMHIELYDNGVQIRTLITRQEVNTIINREVAIDTVSNKIYILEPDSQIKKNPDGSIEVAEGETN
ncbi:Uncharacterized [Syntrophomonas zehnderi OL-4]|uniref:Uncharacterized n=1 Tax=Syntrophomonas zehnderi OL-4 TaxID=690567 RepID=A0A0E4GE55_9FIRM|nr:Uncharacterized [Syntrophomonas zehnderi OL-4]